MPKFSVCFHVVVGVRMEAVEAADEKEAIEISKKQVDFDDLFNVVRPRDGQPYVQHTQYDEDVLDILVDRVGADGGLNTDDCDGKVFYEDTDSGELRELGTAIRSRGRQTSITAKHEGVTIEYRDPDEDTCDECGVVLVGPSVEGKHHAEHCSLHID